MFTGIITDIGTVRSVERRGDVRLSIDTSYDVEGIDMGASISCSGVCLTVVEKGPGWFAVNVSEESLDRSTLSRLLDGNQAPGARLNLERSLRAGDEMGGHIVSGHVDGIGIIAEIEGIGDSKRFVFEIPDNLLPFVAEKGSVAVDGISLTVNRTTDRGFEVNIIPHTQAITTLGGAGEGDKVNIEIDMLARYVARLQEARYTGAQKPEN